jgi:hypothetical protein
MTQFRPDNTEGYTATDLADLNVAWDRLTAQDHLLGFDDDRMASYHKWLIVVLLGHYDAGRRGDELVQVSALG